jgi:hypothetical protein
MIFSFDIQYSLFDILRLKELPRPLNSLMRSNDSGMNCPSTQLSSILSSDRRELAKI